MMRQPLCIVALCCLACGKESPPAAKDEIRTPLPVTERSGCLTYQDTVEVRGILRREIHPGPPNYESVAGGDAEETGFYVHLAETVCTLATRGSPDPGEEPLDSVRRVQLVLDSVGYARLRPQLDHQVTVRGTLFSAFTGHHHAPLLLQVER